MRFLLFNLYSFHALMEVLLFSLGSSSWFFLVLLESFSLEFWFFSVVLPHALTEVPLEIESRFLSLKVTSCDFGFFDCPEHPPDRLAGS